MAKISAPDSKAMNENRKERPNLLRGTTSARKGNNVNSESPDHSYSASRSSRSSLLSSEAGSESSSLDSPRVEIKKRKRSLHDSEYQGGINGGSAKKSDPPEGSASSYSSQGRSHSDGDRRSPDFKSSRSIISGEKNRKTHTDLTSSIDRPPRSHHNGGSPRTDGTTQRHDPAKDDSLSRKEREHNAIKFERGKERSLSPDTGKSSEQTRKVASRKRSSSTIKRRGYSSESESEEDSTDSMRVKRRVESKKRSSKRHSNHSRERKSARRKRTKSRRRDSEESSDDSESLTSADKRSKKISAKGRSGKKTRSEQSPEKGKDRKRRSRRDESKKERSRRRKHRRKKANLESDESGGEENGEGESDGKRLGREKSGGGKHAVSQPLDAKMAEAEDAKEKLRRSADEARKRLNSGEMQQARAEQEEMQRLYGTSDWRSKKKYRSEKRKLEKTVEAGNKLASLEARENERMDAFRIAMGLPSAEAQRQAQWREEASRALAQSAALEREADVGGVGPGRQKKSRIGPRFPK